MVLFSHTLPAPGLVQQSAIAIPKLPVLVMVLFVKVVLYTPSSTIPLSLVLAMVLLSTVTWLVASEGTPEMPSLVLARFTPRLPGVPQVPKPMNTP